MTDLPPPTPPVPSPDPEPTPVPSRRASKIVCEFCDCTLAPSGEVLALGDKARAFRRADDRLERAAADLEAAQADVTRLESELAELKAQTARRPPSAYPFGG